MSKKIKNFSTEKECEPSNSCGMTPIELIGTIPSEYLSKKSFMTVAISISSNISDSDYEPADINIKRMQMAIDSGFNDLPNGLTPDEIIEYIINN